jgi:hypothetical protein
MVLAAIGIVASACYTQAIQMVQPQSYTFVFESTAASGDTEFDGSTVTIDWSSQSSGWQLSSWDIRDGNFPGGFTSLTPGFAFEYDNIAQCTASGFSGSFGIVYLKPGVVGPSIVNFGTINGTGELTGSGTMQDSDPTPLVDGNWAPPGKSAVPETANTVILLGFAASVLAGVRTFKPRLARCGA